MQLPRERVTMLATPPRDADAIEPLAEEVRAKWGLGLGPIGNMINLLERNGIVVVPIDEACREVDAFSLWNGKRPSVFLVMEKGSTSRTRMDAAHELGHLVMHVDVAAGSPELERQANQFGAALLMPRGSFYHEAPRRLTWEHIWELKKRWKVSAAAIIKRTYDLGLFSEATYRRAFVQLNQMGRTHEPHEPPPETSVMVSKALDVIAHTWPLPRIADELGVSAVDLHDLVAFTNPDELPADAQEPPTVDGADGPLFARHGSDREEERDGG